MGVLRNLYGQQPGRQLRQPPLATRRNAGMHAAAAGSGGGVPWAGGTWSVPGTMQQVFPFTATGGLPGCMSTRCTPGGNRLVTAVLQLLSTPRSLTGAAFAMSQLVISV